MSTKKLVIGLTVTTGNSVQELEKVKDAAVAFGGDAARNADKLTTQLENVEKQAEKVSKKITQGRNITVADSAAMAQAFAQLGRVVEQSFGSIENAPQEIQQAFAQAEEQVKAVRTEVVAANKAVDDSKRVTNEAGASWQGLGKSIEDAAGKHGKLLVQAGLVTAAFKEGWQIGQKLNQFFGTDMQMWDHAVSNFASRANAIIRALSDNVVGTFKVLKELWDGNFRDALKAMDDLAETNAEGMRRIGKALTLSNDAWNKYAGTIGIVSDETRRAREETDKLAEEKRKLAERVNEVVASLQAETAELEAQRLAAQDAGLRLVDRTDQLGYYQRALSSATAALREQQAEVARLTAAHGASHPATKAATETLTNLESSLRYSEERYKTTSEEVKQFEAQQRAAERAVEQQRQKIEGLNEKQAELQGGTAAVTAATQSATAATEKHTEAVTKAAPAVKIYTDEAGKVRIVTEEVAAATGEAAAKTEALGEATSTVATSLGQMRDGAAGSRDALWGVVDAMERILELAPAVSAAMRDVGNAGSEAAGDIVGEGLEPSGGSGQGASGSF